MSEDKKCQDLSAAELEQVPALSVFKFERNLRVSGTALASTGLVRLVRSEGYLQQKLAGSTLPAGQTPGTWIATNRKGIVTFARDARQRSPKDARHKDLARPIA
jgi:hypothetical protein